MQARYGHDAFRYFLLREMAFGQDADFSEAALVTRLNADLANGLGNLASRVLAMQQRYFEGALQPLAPDAADLALREAFAAARRELEAHVEQLAFHRGLEAVWRALDHANKYVTETAPFRLAKDPAQRPRVGAILHELCEALRVTAQLVAPFLPGDARTLLVAARPAGERPDRARPRVGHHLPARPSHAAARGAVSRASKRRARDTRPPSSTRTAHVAEAEFDADRAAVLARAAAAGVTTIVCVGATGGVDTNAPAVALAGEHGRRADRRHASASTRTTR